MYFSSDQGETFSRALLPSASTEQVRPRLKKKPSFQLLQESLFVYCNVLKPKQYAFDFALFWNGLMQGTCLFGINGAQINK